MPDNPTPPLEYQIFDPERQEIRVVVIQPPKRRYWLHALLFLATVFTTLCIGARMQYNFDHNFPMFKADADFWPWMWALQDWHRLKLGIPFCFCLLGILTAHEFGHFIFCVRRKVFATLPFFIPAPTLIGTLGAFIRIRSPIRSRADLFDIGIAGPIAGFVVAIPVIFYGLAHSMPLTAEAKTDFAIGMPLMFHLVHWFLAVSGMNVAGHFGLYGLYLHPVAFAGWVGMFATALNLIPGGQLDGGHIVFALKPKLHRPVSMLCIIILLPLSWWLWVGWLMWAVILRLTGSRHPDVPVHPPLDKKRRALAGLAALMLLLSLAPAPFPGQNLSSILDQFRQQRQQQSK